MFHIIMPEYSFTVSHGVAEAKSLKARARGIGLVCSLQGITTGFRASSVTVLRYRLVHVCMCIACANV